MTSIHSTVEEITRSGYCVDMKLSRDLTEGEATRLAALPGVAELATKGSSRYSATLAPHDGENDQDAVTRSILHLLLELQITPRTMSEGSSLEEIFLKMTDKAPS